MKINYYNTPQFSLDKRFNERQWNVGSDPRINRRTKRGFKIKFKTILWIIFWTAIIIAGQYVDRGYLTPAKALQAPTSEVKVESVETPTPQKEVINKPLSIEDKIRAKFGSAGDKFVAIGRCESNLTANRIGDDYVIRGLHAPSVGVFQIRLLDGRPSREWLLNEDNNIQYAFDMFSKQGTRPWLYCGNHWKEFVK
jgi:hypothetical protein